MSGAKRLSLYDRVAEETAGAVIRRYSTSFGLASRLLGVGVRQHVENIYALVRLADEIVDGGAVEAGVAPEAVAQILDAFERETEQAMTLGYSTNLVVHAFAQTARATGFGVELTRPFFASMRADLSETEHDEASFDLYVYGSAEVVGLMCLKAFLVGVIHTETDAAALVHGARRLGAAFQKVNFLRDLAADYRELGRSYFPGINVATFTEDSTKHTFSNLTATGSSVTLTMSGNGAGLAGVQFSTIPEPSSMLLLGLGALGGLGMVVRRARAKA